MYNKLKTISLLMSGLILVACGGNDGSPNEVAVEVTQPVTPTISEVNIKVIDGYLENVQVCVDRNLDMACQDDEYLEAKTTALGDVVIDQADSEYPLIAKVLQGISIDADSGFANHSYEMIAPAGSLQITPYTTLAVLNGITNAELAASLSLSMESIFDDYILGENSNLQIIARSVVNTLDILSETNAQNALATAIDISTFVSNTTFDDPSSTMVSVTDSGLVTTSVDPTIKTTLVSSPVWTFANLDADTFAEEGFLIARLSETSVSLANQWDNLMFEDQISYNAYGILNAEGSEYQEKFVYVSNDLLVAQASGNAKDLNVWMSGFKGEKQINFTKASFDEELFKNDSVWYNVFDDGAEIIVAEMTFSNSGSLEIVELATNTITSTTFTIEGTSLRDNALLNIELPHESQPLRFESWYASGHILVVYGQNRDNFSLMTQSLETALAIANQ